MAEKEKDCGDRGERRSKRHGVSFSEREREWGYGSVNYCEKEREKRGLRLFYTRSLSLHDKFLEMGSIRGL